MADEGAETPTVLPKVGFYFVLQTAASDNSNRHSDIRIFGFEFGSFKIEKCKYLFLANSQNVKMG